MNFASTDRVRIPMRDRYLPAPLRISKAQGIPALRPKATHAAVSDAMSMTKR